MEYLTFIILSFSLVLLVVQYSLIEKKSLLIMLALLFTVLAYFMHNKAIEQSYATFKRLLTNDASLINLAVLQVIEAILGILLSISLIRKEMGERIKQWIDYLIYFPGIIWLIALFYAESYLFLVIRTESFSHLAMFIAMGVGILMVLLVLGFKWLMNEFDLRCEIKFLLHIVQIVMASALYISITGLSVSKLPKYGSLSDLGMIALLFFISIVTGYIIYGIKMKRLKKQMKL